MGAATGALMWSDGWEIRGGREVWREVLPALVVNQETNGGESNQELTGCSVNNPQGHKGENTGGWKG